MLLEVPRREDFTFERRKVVTTTKKITKEVKLKGDMSSKTTTAKQFQTALRDNDIVSPSGRTLSEILSLSYPDDLSRDSVESVRAGWRTGGKVVTYSPSESTEAVIVSSINLTHPLIPL
jgi:hypothetical protein